MKQAMVDDELKFGEDGSSQEQNLKLKKLNSLLAKD